jgi:hypothetical protein
MAVHDGTMPQESRRRKQKGGDGYGKTQKGAGGRKVHSAQKSVLCPQGKNHVFVTDFKIFHAQTKWSI